MTEPDHAAWNTTVRDHIDRLEARIAKQEEQIAEAARLVRQLENSGRLPSAVYLPLQTEVRKWLDQIDQ